MSEPIIKVTPEEWDAQYRAGSWDYLKDVTAHYGVIGSLIRKHGCSMILDVGSGAGTLIEFLPSVKGAYYGLDISREAALLANVNNVVTAVCDAENFVTHTEWHCAVFCESLYYMPDPLEVLARYFEFCKIIFISMTSNPETNALTKQIRERFTIEEKWELFNSGHYFLIMAVKP